MTKQNNDVLLELRDIRKYFPLKEGILRRTVADIKAVDGISLKISAGQTTGLVGESGCGKTTLGQCILRLIDVTSGSIHLHGRDITHLKGKELRLIRKNMQIIFQDPYSSLNPRLNVEQLIGEALTIHNLAKGQKQRQQVTELLDTVGLPANSLSRYPHEFSGGQRQRICIARALAVKPRLMIADEPVSALDVSIQAQIINLLIDLQREFSLSYLFISHDLGVVKAISDYVAVMYLGRIVEYSQTETLYSHPLHPYTKAILSVIPIPDPVTKRKRIILEGDVPTPINIPAGCRFYGRCPRRVESCLEADPPLEEKKKGHFVACFRVNKDDE